MNLQSFNVLPAVDIFIDMIDQEIRVDDAHYNVMTVLPLDRSMTADLIVWGRYLMSEELPQRFTVDFYAAELRSPHGVGDDELRQAFKVPPGHPLRSDLKPMKLHSDVVYCDDDMRIFFSLRILADCKGGTSAFFARGCYGLSRIRVPQVLTHTSDYV